MTIHVYTVCWNEERFLPYFVRHYGTIAQRIVLYDNESTDRSVEIARADPRVEVRTFTTGGQLRDDVNRQVKNACWKESRGKADWVVVVDVDELLWHPELSNYLQMMRRRGVTVPVPTGFEMVADSFPTTVGQVYEEVKLGSFNREYSKPCVFNPDAIEEINYTVGAHQALPAGRVLADQRNELKLLHFRFLGLDYVLPRFEAKRQRLSDENKRWDWGMHYQMERDRVIEYVERHRAKRMPVIP